MSRILLFIFYIFCFFLQQVFGCPYSNNSSFRNLSLTNAVVDCAQTNSTILDFSFNKILSIKTGQFKSKFFLI